MSYTRMNEKKHIEDQDWELLAKEVYDEPHDNQTEILSAIVGKVVRDEKECEQLVKTVEQVDRYFSQKNFHTDKAWEKVNAKIHAKPNIDTGRVWLLFSNSFLRIAAAAIFAAILLVSGYEVVYNRSASAEILEISATNSVLKTYTLPDGTNVSLNTNTKISYPKRFGSKTREVTIEGEAFFEVKPNKNKPFIIHAGNAQIKVLGTSFNVNAYPTTKSVEVIVETGKVQVLNKTTETTTTNELILTPGEKGTLVFSNNSMLKTTNQNPNFLAWKTRNLIFKATSLGEVIESLQKVYNVNIRLADPKLNELLLTAQFKDYSLDFILKVIETTLPIETQKVDEQYILKAKS